MPGRYVYSVRLPLASRSSSRSSPWYTYSMVEMPGWSRLIHRPNASYEKYTVDPFTVVQASWPRLFHTNVCSHPVFALRVRFPSVSYSSVYPLKLVSRLPVPTTAPSCRGFPTESQLNVLAKLTTCPAPIDTHPPTSRMGGVAGSHPMLLLSRYLRSSERVMRPTRS